MTERDRWIGTREMCDTLSVGRTYANQLMQMFKGRGQAYDLNINGKKPMWRVKERVFRDWLNHECKER